MNKWHNESGKPLSSFKWLKAHHLAKLPERIAFAKQLIDYRPKTIIDLGCGPGLWLEVLNEFAPPDCAFIGIDADNEALEIAERISQNWERKVSFISLDIEKQVERIPQADLYLMFNMFSYILEPSNFLKILKSKLLANGRLVVRQYDGAALRFGPMQPKERALIDGDLLTALGSSKQFHHFDLDVVFKALQDSEFASKILKFELFQRTAPYSPEFFKYFDNTIDWTTTYISENARKILNAWRQEILYNNSVSSYFYEVDLTAVLS